MPAETARAVVERTSLLPAVEEELRRRARVRSTHFSTRIEGNRLTGQVSPCQRRPRRAT